MAKSLYVTMPDGSTWAVPVEAIAEHKAAWNVTTFRNTAEAARAWVDIEFQDDDRSIHIWASEHMTWDEVKDRAVRVGGPSCDYGLGWRTGDWVVAESSGREGAEK